jgi:predicted RNA-binding Zn-ribbon protein involved in translation (DUF1610 family)
MAILTLKDGKRYQEVCPECGGVHIYDQKARGISAETERFLCADCGHKSVAPVLKPVSDTATEHPQNDAKYPFV